MRRMPWMMGVLAIVVTACWTGCSDDDDSVTDPGSVDPPIYATVGFAIDDTADQLYTAADGLAWKGSFSYDPATRILTHDGVWSGPYAMLHDDGPVSAGGREPEGAVAGDHIWSVSVLVDNTDETILEYGAISGSVDGSDGDWIWDGPNGTVTIAAGATGPIEAPGLVVEDDTPTNVAQVTFAIDDTANHTYTAVDGLAWKGSFSYDASTRVLTRDGAWSGPYVLLHDDGPLSQGGHEPEGAVADDHVWSVSVLVDNSEEQIFEYGAIRGSVDGSDGDWIWLGSNGVVTVPAGATGPIAAPGLTLPAHGTIDLRLTIDLSADGANLAPDFQGVDHLGNVAVKGTAWGWQEIAMVDDGSAGDVTAGDGIATFVLSLNNGPHDGLLRSGDRAEFVIVLSGVEYRQDGACATGGVSAALDDGGGWTVTDIEVQPTGSRNTFVDVP